MNDLKFALRQLLKNPGFAAVAVLTLALGIGATTAIFSVIYGVLIRPYPYARPDEIWVPGTHSASVNQPMRPFRNSEFDAMAALPAFSDMMGTTPGSVLLSGEFAAENLTAPRLTANAFGFIGVAPLLGRTFGTGDVSASGVAEPVTVITYKLWQRLFGGDPEVLGRTLRLDDQVYTVVGVMPSHFGWWTIDGLWLPASRTPGVPGRLFPLGRLKPGVAPAVVRQQLQSVETEMARVNPADFPKETFEATLTNYLDLTVASGEMHTTLQLLFGAVAFLLLIACANIANLQLARATGRGKEMAVRLAIGAGRGRLIRQLLTESLLLSGLGGVLGLAFSVGLTQLMVALMPESNIPAEARIEVNGPVLLFSVAVAIVTGIAFGLVPALQSTRPNLSDALKNERTAGGAPRGGVFRSSLVVLEMALSVILLISAGLTIRSFLALQQVDPGFRVENVVTADVMFPRTGYTTVEQRNRFTEELLDRVQHLPGVQAATIGNGGTPFGGPQSPYSINGQPGAGSQPMTFNLISADYFKTLGIALRKGRMLMPEEIRRGEHLAVINETAAKLWPAGVDPLGRQISVDLLKGSFGSVLMATNPSPEVTVIGICADTRNNGLTSEAQPAAFIPFMIAAPPGRTLAIRASGDPAALFNALRREVAALDSRLPVGNTRTLEKSLADQTAQPRFTMTVFSLFAAVGLTLATVGLFSVLSYLVTRRTREIGIRMALGAQRRDVLGLVLKDGGRLAGLGILLGTIASLGVARLIGSLVDLYHVKAIDPVSFVTVIVVLGTVALLACWLPARRAASVNPNEALRSE
ncbi:MAG TPA: ABC transporter permease [Candidatus Limnocylindria bacterium]|nr:ABC transporter permease [Candidatus Limnocylindria bacterium]